MTDLTAKTAIRGDVLHLVFIGFIGVATSILCGVAALPLLGIGQEPVTTSRIGHNVLPPYTHANAVSVPPETSPTNLDSAKVLPAFPRQDATISATSAVTGGEPTDEQPLPDGDASTTTSDTADVALIPDFSIIATRPTEISGSDHATTEPLAVAAPIIIPDASRSVPTAIIPAEERDQTPPDAEIRQNRPGKLERASPASNDKTAAQRVQNPRVHGHLLNPNAAFNQRVQKECGPITFPALRRHCMASFGIHHQ